MPGEDERPPDHSLEAARLDLVAARLETLGLGLQRAIAETTESTATLSRSVGTVSSELGQLVGEAITALGNTRKIALATDDSVGHVVVAFEEIEQRLAEIAGTLADTIDRQRRLEDDRPDPEVLAAAVGTEVGRALEETRGAFSTQLDELLAELRTERAALAQQLRTMGDPPEPPRVLTERDVRAQVEAVVETIVGPWLGELRDELTQLVAEIHEDRSVLARRLPAQRDLDELREVVDTLAARTDIEELQIALEAALADRGDTSALDHLRADIQALTDDLGTTAKRASASQRAIEGLQQHLENVLPASVERTLAAASTDITKDTEALISELHDDLVLVMRQVVAGNQELEALREAVAALTETTGETEETPDAAAEITPVVHGARDEVIAAVADLHEDLALVLKRLSATQREMDDVREALLARPEVIAPDPVDPADVAQLVGRELRAPFAELSDDLSVLVRSVSSTQEELDGLRASLAELAETVAAASVVEEVEYEEAEVDAGPDLGELVDGLRADVEAGLGAAVTDLRDELDSVRRMVAEQAAPLGAGDIRAEIDPLLADVRDDLALLAQQVVVGNEEVTALRAEVVDGLSAVPEGTDAGDVAAATAAAVGDEVRAEIATLSEELRSQFDRLRQVLNRPRPEPEPVELPDLSGLGPEVALEVNAVVEPVVAGIHDDLAALVNQLAAAQAAIEASAPVDVAAEIQAVVADLHDDLSLVLGQVVAAQQEVQATRDDLMGGQDDLRAVLQAIATGQDEVRNLALSSSVDPDDLRAVIDVIASGHGDMQALREDVASLLEAVLLQPSTANAPVDLESLEIAIADLPTLVGNEVRVEVDALAEELRTRLRQLEEATDAAAIVGGSGDPEALAAILNEVQALAADFQTDVGTLIREIVASHDEVSQLRVEVAGVVDAVSEAVPPAPVEDPALAIEGMRADLTAGLADMAADLRGDVEGLITELHEDLGTLMARVVAGQQELDALRQQLGEVLEAVGTAGPTEHVADDLDRLTRDLQALRDRIPGSAGAATRRPRAPRNRS